MRASEGRVAEGRCEGKGCPGEHGSPCLRSSVVARRSSPFCRSLASARLQRLCVVRSRCGLRFNLRSGGLVVRPVAAACRQSCWAAHQAAKGGGLVMQAVVGRVVSLVGRGSVWSAER